MQWGIYIHIPFCRQKCLYCDFASYAGREKDRAAYLQALEKEMRERVPRYLAKWGAPRTIYLGGGTPTALKPGQMAGLFDVLADILHGAYPVEWTVEANPGTVDFPYLSMLRKKGVNRLSFGVQSFDDTLLRRIGRIHTADQVEQAIRWAKQAGFENLSIDLMYGLPGQTLEDLQESVGRALALEPTHISIYGLQVEAGTPFARLQEQGRLALPNDETAEAMYDYMTETLPAHGYARYEISNFARPGFESRHNLSYWQNVPYLGLGVAAHSYLDGCRTENEADLSRYIEDMERGISPAREEEPRTTAIAMEEFAFLALRTAAGISRRAFGETFGVPLECVYAGPIAEMEQKGLLVSEGDAVRLTARGAKYGNLVFEAFLLDEDEAAKKL
ncbi:MAG: radical SAM family heme chaperone HemW [Selenomonadaceae bacterium]|nr:radical SAM family heme chaperone HemW [Selenomonadaceae bacterium]